MRILFSFALFFSAALVFWVQPMFGKLVLPLLGGTPAVWNTCLVFFQSALLLGYLYAHTVTERVDLSSVKVTHVLLFAVFLIFLPVGLPCGWIPPTETNPIVWLLALLAVAVGFPFVLLCASTPLLQGWYSQTGPPEKVNPYFLYAVSNAGSLVGLLGYPILIEPHLSLKQQAWAWSIGYVSVFLLIVAAAAMTRNRRRSHGSFSLPKPSTAPEVLPRIRWLVLAAIPVALLQSMTTHITTDVAAVPLLWVIPLSLYLLSLILVFSPANPVPHGAMVRLQPVVLVILVVSVYWTRQDGLMWNLLPNLAVLFVSAMVCHGELVRLRPSPARLTEFYLWVALGGVTGGILTAIVAPLVFENVTEYPLCIVLAALAGSPKEFQKSRFPSYGLDLLLPLALLVVLTAGAWQIHHRLEVVWVAPYLLLLAIPAGIFVYLTASRPVRFALGCGVLMVTGQFAGIFSGNLRADTMLVERSFFGVSKVQLDRHADWIAFSHGTTLHGSQYRDPALRREPTCYHSRSGPLGDVFAHLAPVPAGRKVAVAGLGAGTMACYAQAGDHWVFYEIDPAVARIARDTRYFSYISDSPAQTELVLGDARISLEKAPDRYFDIIALDAFSSDSVPVHLLTKEAFDLYSRKLAPSGVIVVNLTNRHLEFEGVMACVAHECGLKGLIRRDVSPERQPKFRGTCASNWVVLAKNGEDLAGLRGAAHWKILSERPGLRAWTDDFSNLFQCLKILQ